MDIIIKGKAEEAYLRLLIDLWERAEPHTYKAFLKQVDEKRTNLYNPDGTSLGGGQVMGLFPKFINDCANQPGVVDYPGIGPGEWEWTPEKRDLFYKIFEKAKMQKRKVKRIWGDDRKKIISP